MGGGAWWLEREALVTLREAGGRQELVLSSRSSYQFTARRGMLLSPFLVAFSASVKPLWKQIPRFVSLVTPTPITPAR